MLFSKLSLKAFNNPAGSVKVHTPKNRAQAHYEAGKLRKLESQDALFDLYEFQFSVNEFVRCLDLADGVKVVLMHWGFVASIKKLYEHYDIIRFSYDTTFNRVRKNPKSLFNF